MNTPDRWVFRAASRKPEANSLASFSPPRCYSTTLAEVECSAACLPEARRRDDLDILSDPRPLPFDAGGNLCDEHMEPAATDQD